ncbi:protein kinase [Kribbella qitaiheensis]|uniref:non-specific serine/threonine protein kinase n=1 Tax=Kribbella qitaiheensis TaxID=1544730 RepID=A0A7G6X3H0_9ACTN|nr:serine/threonine-protein kinase [Kribbella qitaiheensis]QNE20785.1 protein kinase [Kribbella qitaiheensis]
MLVAERYRVGASLGRGGMGEVYRGTDELLGRAVAIKFLLPTRHDELAAARFHREARAAALLNDQHVVAAFDFGRHEDGYFLVMELVEGRSVAEELKTNGPLPGERALDIVRQAAAGLAAAHREDIVHRDIKPGNLLLGVDGAVKVADFGIARFVADTTTTLTATGQVLGTSFYMSPEQAEGGPAETSSDVYALGCVLYQLVTGHPPFQGDQPASIMYQHVAVAPVPPSDLRPELAGACETLMFRMLAKDPADRPTAAEVATGAPLVPLARPQNEAPTAQIPALRPKRAVLAGAAAVVAIAVAVALAVLIRSDPGRLPTTDLLPSKPPAVSTPPSTARTTPPPVARTTRPPSTVVAGTRTNKPSTTGKSPQPSSSHTKGHAKTPQPKSTKPPKATKNS